MKTFNLFSSLFDLLCKSLLYFFLFFVDFLNVDTYRVITDYAQHILLLKRCQYLFLSNMRKKCSVTFFFYYFHFNDVKEV